MTVRHSSVHHPSRYQIPDTPPNSVAVGAADVLSRVYEPSFNRPDAVTTFKNYSGTLHLECQGTLHLEIRFVMCIGAKEN